MNTFQELIAKDRAAIAQAKIESPEGFQRASLVDTRAILRSIGIEAGIPEEAPLGYIKLLPQDFIVEEVWDNEVVPVLREENRTANTDRLPTLYMDLIKCDMETLSARDRIAEALRIPPDSIGYGGIKDKVAITAQQISLRGVKEIPAMEEDNFFLRFSHWGKGVLRPGYLKGNRFTITVRMQSEADAQTAIAGIERVRQHGFWNFFYLQRFAAPRLIGHTIGKAVLTREYEEAIRLMVTETGEREFKYFSTMRDKAKTMWGAWDKIYDLFDRFPHHFRYEREVLLHLMQFPGDYFGALKMTPDHIKLCIYSYQSYLWNRRLSDAIVGGAAPQELAFPSMDPGMYQSIFKEEGLQKIEMPLFLQRNMGTPKPLPTFVMPEIHASAVHGSLLLLSFSLPKGAYATSMLMHIMSIASDQPVVENITRESIDAPALLGQPSIQPVIDRFKDVISRSQETGSGEV